MSGGKGGGTSTTTQSIPKWVEDEYKYVVGKAKDIEANTSFTPYTGEFTAPLSTTQQAGIQNVNNAQGMALPAYQYGMGLTAQAGQGVTPQFSQAGLDPYMSPYLNSVVGSTMANLQEQNKQQQNQALGSTISRGAYGGDRYGIQQAEMARQQGLATGQTLGNLLQSGYGQALGQYNQNIAQQQADQQRRLAAGAQFGQLGTGAQNAALSGAQAQLMAGAQEQATRQAQDQALYNQFLQQQAYPFQKTSWLANIAEGIGSQSGGTSSTTAPGQSNVGSILGSALSAASMFAWSDERLKEDKEVVGKTFDGQPIYKYRMKDGSAPQLGLMAQDVEKSHPEAVREVNGYKQVNYDAATENAAERGHFASGGLVPMGFADGGVPQFGMMPYVGLAKGLGYIPQANIPVGKSTIPKPPPAPPQDNTAQQIMKGLNAMPQGAKDAMKSGLGFGQSDASKALGAMGQKGDFGGLTMDKLKLPSYTPSADPAAYAEPGFMDALKSGLSGLFGGGGYADGGVVPRGHYDEGGPVSETPAADALRALMAQKDETEVVPVKTPKGVVPVAVPKSEATGVAPTSDDFESKLARMRATTAAVESGNNPRIMGKVIPSGPYAGDRAYGLYQVMGKNVPEWTEKALGRRMTPEEYLNDTEAQHAVYNKIAGDNLRKYGNIPDAVSVWASGRPLGGNTTRDLVSGVPTSGYVDKFMKRMGENGNLGEIKNAYTGTAPTGVVAKDPDMPLPNANPAGGFVVPNPPQEWTKKGLGDRLTDTEGAPRSLIERITGTSLSDEARSGLLAAGLGMMASRGRTIGQQIGEGGLGGLQTYYNALANKQALEKQQADIGFKERETAVSEKRVGIEEKTKALEALKFWQSRFVPVATATGIVYRDTVNGTEIPESEYQRQLQGIIRQYGLAPSEAGVSTPSTTTSTGKPQVTTGEPKPEPTTAPKTAEPKPEAGKPEQPPAVNADAFKNVHPDYNPDILRNKAMEQERIAANAQRIKDDKAEASARAQAKYYRDEADKIMAGDKNVRFLDGSVGPIPELASAKSQREADQKFAEKQAESKSKFTDEGNSYLKSYESQKALTQNLINVYQKVELNRLSEAKADLIGIAKDIPGIRNFVDDYMRAQQAGNDLAMKEAVTSAFKAIAENQANKAPATALREALMTVASPNMAAGAKYSLLTGQLARAEQEKDLYEAWIKSGKKGDHDAFVQKFREEHPYEKYEQDVVNGTKYFAGMSKGDIEILKNKRPTETTSAPTGGGITKEQIDAARAEIERRKQGRP